LKRPRFFSEIFYFLLTDSVSAVYYIKEDIPIKPGKGVRMIKKAIIKYIMILMAMCCMQNTSMAGWSEPVPVQELNMSGDELLPYLSADGQIMLFSAEGTVTMSHWNGSAWGPREYLPAPINYVGLQDQAAITPDKCWICWISWRAGGMGMWDIWRASWDDSSRTCGPAECLGPNVNSADIEGGICFTSDGHRMYFDTDTHYKNGQYNYGSNDIWYAEWDSLISDWGEPFILGAEINTTDIERTPFLSLDNQTIFFSCAGGHHLPGWQGGWDIYKGHWNGSVWESVQNIGPPINSSVQDFGPTISPNGLKLYFTTERDRVPNADYELMVSTWESEGISDDVPSRDYSIKIECYPNPFNERAEIRVFAELESTAGISIYDINGLKVRGYETVLNSGSAAVTWDSRNQQGQKVATGNYILKINFPSGKEIRKLITLLK
jgi:hypothetical protein